MNSDEGADETIPYGPLIKVCSYILALRGDTMKSRRQILKQCQANPCRQTMPRATAEKGTLCKTFMGANSQREYSRNSKKHPKKQRTDSNQ